jgi:hypothetical protein
MTAAAASEIAGALRPTRARLADVLACVTGIDFPADAPIRDPAHARHAHHLRIVLEALPDAARAQDLAEPAAAWEALAARGAIPLAWCDEARRSFRMAVEVEGRVVSQPNERVRTDPPAVPFSALRAAPPHTQPRGLITTGARVRYDALVTQALPHTLVAAVAIASDVPGVTQAEALARECARAIDARADRVVWHVRRARFLYEIGVHIRAWMFERLHARGLNAALLATGYGLESVDDDEIVLVCPTLEAPAEDLTESSDVPAPRERERGR